MIEKAAAALKPRKENRLLNETRAHRALFFKAERDGEAAACWEMQSSERELKRSVHYSRGNSR